MTTFDPHNYPSVEAATAFVFAPGGPLVAQGFEVRESQRSLALAVARAIDAESGPAWVLGEAPCGTGKGIAYLVPGIIAALRQERLWLNGERPEGQAGFRKLVVSTANIALQSQLVNKDVPGVAAILGVEVRCALYKGRNNFLCKERLQEQAGGLITDQGVRRLVDWARRPDCSGDREDLQWDPGAAWARVSVGSDECHGRKCRYYRADDPQHLCFAERSRAGMSRAHVVIVNHYLLTLSPKPIPSVFLAVDEGHELEDCMRKAASSSIGQRSAAWIAARVQTLLGPDRARDVQAPLEDLFQALGDYMDDREAAYTEPLHEGWSAGTFDPDLLLSIRKVADDVARLSRQATDENEGGKLDKLADTIDQLYLKAATIAMGKPSGEMSNGDPAAWAVWGEIRQDRDQRGNKTRTLTGHMAPADVSARFQALQRAYPKAVLTSATLAVDGGFTYVCNMLGMGSLGQPPEFADVVIQMADNPAETKTVRRQIKAAGPVEELILPSPYNLSKMGALIVPSDVMNPKDGRWAAWAAEKVVEVVGLAQGRTLVLASSTRQMQAYGSKLEQSSPYPVRVQGSAGRTELIRWFTETTNGVLVATRSFFQGLDVKGESLSCVVIDRVPFDPPGDPLEEAVGELVASRVGGNPFSVRSLPRTCMVLAQAAGRLIRAQADRGVVVCLDAKVVTGGMASVLRRSFTGLPLSRDMGDVTRVIAGAGVAAAPLRAGSIRRHHA